MRRAKKGLVAALLAAIAGCFAFTALILPKNDYAAKNGSESVTVAPESSFGVMGGSVRLNADKPGVRFHVTMPKNNFTQIGTLDGNGIGTLNEGYSTGTLLVPEYVAPAELVVGAPKVSDTDTSDLWYTKEGWDYVQSVVYLYNIPATEYGTPIYVRGYLKDGEGNYVYTEQVNSISMSYVALAEYNDENTELSEQQLSDMKELYIDKTINVHIGGEVTEIKTAYAETIAKSAAASRAADNDVLVGFFDQYGDAFDFKRPVKNNTNVYAYYRESIVLKSLADDFTGPSFPISHYKRNASDTVVGGVITFTAADGSEYTLTYDAATEKLTGVEALTAEKKDHGEGTVTATMLNGVTGKNYTLTLPALVVTQDITTLAEIGASVRDTNINGGATVTSNEFIFQTTKYAASDCGSTADEAAQEAASLFGYYRITKDLGRWVSGGNFAFASWVNNGINFGKKNAGAFNHPLQGFRGTIDGCGYTIVGYIGQRGWLAQIGTGAVIKNLNIKHGGYGNYTGNQAVLATSIINATIENVTVKAVGSSAAITTTTQNIGFLTNAGASGTTFKNVTVDARGLGLNSIFGGHFWSGGYESLGNGQNIYEDFVIYANEVGAMGYKINGSNTAVTDDNILVTVEEEIAEGNDIRLENTLGNQTAVLGAAVQKIVLDDPTTWSIDIGSYVNKGKILSIKLGSHDLGTDLDYLTIPETLKTDLQSHGENKTLTVTIQLPDTTANSNLPESFKLTLSVPVTIVTAQIKTTQQFEQIFTYPEAKAYYGYYVLANDIGSSTWKFAAGSRGSANCEYRANGFRGIFDGQGYTITGYEYGGGLFGWIGVDAIIRNVNIVDYGQAGLNNRAIFASTIARATLENIQITVMPNSVTVPTDHQYVNGLLANQWAYGNTLNDVTIEAGVNDLYALFGSGWYSGYEHTGTNTATPVTEENTYNNVVVNANSLQYVGYYYLGSTSGSALGEFFGVTTEDGVTVNKTQTEFSATLEHTDIVLNGTNARNDLDLGQFATWEVTGITDGFEYANGKLIVAEDIKADKRLHGEQTVEIVLTSMLGQVATVTAPITLVTMEIMNKDEFEAAMVFEHIDTNSNGTAEYWEYYTYGYYTLGANIGSENLGQGQPWRFAAFGGKSNWGDRGLNNPEQATSGFLGTFDGRGYEIKGRSGYGGLFGLLGRGSVIKDVTITDVLAQGAQKNYCVLASHVREATLQGVTFKYSHATWTTSYLPTNPGGQQYTIGWISSAVIVGTTFTDCTVDAAGYDFYALFGSGWYVGYEHTSTDKTPAKMDNVYDNFHINVNSLSYLGYWYEGSTSSTALGTFHGITVEDEVGDDDGQDDVIYFNGNRVYAELPENPTYAQRDIILKSSVANKNVATVNDDGSATLAMNLDVYEKFVTEMTLTTVDGENYGLTVNTENGTYVIPEEVVGNELKHGEGLLKVSIHNPNRNQTFTFNVPVIVVTREVYTMAEMKEVLAYKIFDMNGGGITTDQECGVFGYYTLAQDITYTAIWSDWNLNYYSLPTNPDTGKTCNPEYEYFGFRATFDGRGHTITGRQYGGGVFGNVGRDAVIKNLNIVDVYWHNNTAAVLANTMSHATVENVNIEFKPIDATKIPTATEAYNTQRTAWIVSQWCLSTTFRNVTISANVDVNGNAAEYGIGGLFGSCSYGGYEWKSNGDFHNTYDGLYINIANLYSLGTKYDTVNKVYYGITVEEEVNDDDGMNDIIYLNGEKVAKNIEEISEYEAKDVVLNGAKKTVKAVDASGNATVEMPFGVYTEFVDSATYTDKNDNTYDLNYNAADGTFVLPAAVYNNLDAHGVGTMQVNVVKADSAQNFTFTLPVTVVTLEITTADEISRFLRDYASVAKDEVYHGFTAAGQTRDTAGLTFTWDGTNEYSGYFTLGADVDYSQYQPTDKSLGVYSSGGVLANPYDAALGATRGGYYFPMGIEVPSEKDASHVSYNKGFRGTFDGRGYAIIGMKVMGYASHAAAQSTNGEYKDHAYTRSGFISKMTEDGVIKNVRFKNCQSYLGAFITAWGRGTVESIIVDNFTNIGDGQYQSGHLINANGLSGATNNALDQYPLFKNSIVYLNNSNNTKPLVGYGYVKSHNLENVYFVGAHGGSIITYYNSLYTNTMDKKDSALYVSQPMGMDAFEYYTSLNEFVSQRADIVNAWGNMLQISGGNILFNGAIVADGDEIAADDTDALVRTDGRSDYIIVVEEDNQQAMEAAAYIAEHVRRATGTVTYTDFTNTYINDNTIAVEHLAGGAVLMITTDAVWSETANYIVLGNVDGLPQATAPTNSYRIEANGESVFISVSDNIHYLAAAMRFLEQTIGYQGLNDSYVRYTDVASVTDTALCNQFETAIDEEVAFQRRSTTNANYGERVSYKGINGQNYFNYGPGYTDKNGNFAMHGIHNSMYWLPNGASNSIYPVSGDENLTLPAGYQSQAKWYSTDTRVNNDGTSSEYTGYDLCYIARGDTTAYNAMVEAAANHMLNVLELIDPNDEWEVPLSFGCMDDLNMYYQCNCGATNKYGVKHNGSQYIGTREIIDFLNAVAAKVSLKRTNYSIYLLAYYYAEDPANVTTMDTHLGVIYAPISRTEETKGGSGAVETKSIYATENAEVRARIAEWTALTDKMAFWFYDTRFENFFMPLDTFESMITWLEYAARTCKEDTIGWVTVNGQSANVNPTVFEDFKAYTVQMAEIEVLQKITIDYNTDPTGYNDQLKAYLRELEQEYFGFTGDGTAQSQFVDGGYYGPAEANYAMYKYYKLMRTNYQNKVGSNQAYAGKNWYGGATLEAMTGTCGEYYDYVKYGTSAGTQSSTSKFADYLSGSGTYMYFANFTKSEINAYMNYLETAMTAVKNWNNPAKNICYRNVLQESLFPRYIVCMSNSRNATYGFSGGYSHSGKSNWTGDLASARTQFYKDCVELGWVRYSEHNSLSLIFDKWVKDGTTWSRPDYGVKDASGNTVLGYKKLDGTIL